MKKTNFATSQHSFYSLLPPSPLTVSPIFFSFYFTVRLSERQKLEKKSFVRMRVDSLKHKCNLIVLSSFDMESKTKRIRTLFACWLQTGKGINKTIHFGVEKKDTNPICLFYFWINSTLKFARTIWLCRRMWPSYFFAPFLYCRTIDYFGAHA